MEKKDIKWDTKLACRTPFRWWSNSRVTRAGSLRGTIQHGRGCFPWGSCKERGLRLALFLLFSCGWSWGRPGSSRRVGDRSECFTGLGWLFFTKFLCWLGRGYLLPRNRSVPSIVLTSVSEQAVRPKQILRLLLLQRNLLLARPSRSPNPYRLLSCGHWCLQTHKAPSHHRQSST